jgi:hypothetical protein
MGQIGVIEVSDDKYYGMINALGNKGFVVRANFEAGYYRMMSVEGFTNGNSYSSNYNLTTLISKFTSDGCKVFEFDTYQELFKWLIEDEK